MPSMPVECETLHAQVWAEPMTKVAARYGVSSSFLARVCERLNVPRPARGYWARLAVGKATPTVIERLDQSFFCVRFDRLTPSERRFLRAMAELGPGAQRPGDIADTLGLKVASISPVRAQLIRKGMVYSPAHGDMDFTVPLFDEFMRRAMPHFGA
jgi:hypothetical protein